MNEAFPPRPRENSSDTPGAVDQWLREARDGSRTALGRIMEARRNHLLLVANRSLGQNLRSKIGASDLVQDTYVEAQRNFGHFRGSTEQEFHAWLLGILANRLANAVRFYRQTQKRAVDRELSVAAVDAALSILHDGAATPGTRMLVDDEQRRVRLALQYVQEPWRSVLVERIWQGATFAEIGVRRNRSAEAARKLWVRGVRKCEKH